MSKSVSIQEGGTAKVLTVDKLKTNLSGGGTCLWVPEDTVGLETKHINANGTFAAASDGKYGFSTVYVNVPGGAGGPPGEEGCSIVGTDPNDGEEYVVEIDENGDIVKTMMPSGIAITTLPTKLSYTDGEAIDFSGIVVKLKKHDGTFYTDENYPDSIIPFAELTFPVTEADASEVPEATYTKDGIIAVKETCNTQATNYGTIGYVNNRSLGKDRYQEIWYPVRRPAGDFYLTVYNNTVYACVPDNPEFCESFWISRNGGASFAASGGSGVDPYHKQSFGESGLGGAEAALADWIPVSSADPQGVDFSNPTKSGGTQTIPVQWTPPASKFPSQKTRSTTFEITVTAAGGTTVDDEGFSGTEGNF